MLNDDFSAGWVGLCAVSQGILKLKQCLCFLAILLKISQWYFDRLLMGLQAACLEF